MMIRDLVGLVRASLFGAAVVAAVVAMTASVAEADVRDEMLAVYTKFAAAQNTRNLENLRPFFLDSPQFLWVSDGMSIWGPEATLERMSLFQQAEVWHVDPDLANAMPVQIGPDVGYLHLPLTLTLGRAAAPETFRFLVSVLFTRTPAGWRIAALLTTTEKRSP